MESTVLIEKLIRLANEHEVSADELTMCSAAIGAIASSAAGVRSYLELHAQAAPTDQFWRDRTGSMLVELGRRRGWVWPKPL